MLLILKFVFSRNASNCADAKTSTDCGRGEEGDATSHVRSATITVVSDVVQTLELHRFEFERLVEMGTIGQEVLQRVRALQADRREIREALHPPPEEQQAIGDDEGDTDGGTARLVVSPPSPPPPEGKRED